MWIPQLESTIVSLCQKIGSKLYSPTFDSGRSSSSNSNFQINIAHPSYNLSFLSSEKIIAELEDICTTLSVCEYPLGKGWVSRLYLQIGISHAELAESYMKLFDLWTTTNSHQILSEKTVQYILSSVFILLKWTTRVYEYVYYIDISDYSV